MTPDPVLPNRDLALAIAEILADTPASDALILDIHEIASFADYFVLCSGDNERQLRAISEQVREELAARAVRPTRVEGTVASGWIVLDFDDVIVHILSTELRAFYGIERLWAEAPTLLSMQ